MKKNLFGAVAAGLALALAITSFGCESGSDDPVKLATDLGNPVTAGSKFTYVATPSSYTPSSTAEEHATGTTGSYDWTSYDSGTNSYNRRNSTETSRGTVKGSENGDVVKTIKETITLNDKDKTFSVLTETTSKEVFEIVDAAYTGSNTNSVKTVAAKAGTAAQVSANTFAVTAFAITDSAINGGEITPGFFEQNASSGYKSYDEVVEAIKTVLKNGATAYDAVTEFKDTPAAKKALIETYNNKVKALNEAIVLIDAVRYGAVKIIVETDAAAKTTTSYLKADGNNAIAPVVAAGTAPKAKTGTYKFLSGNYKDGTILVTSFDKVTWDDDAGTYVNDGYKGDIAVTYPEATDTIAASTGRKAARTLTISNKTLTFPKVTNCTTTAAGQAATITYGFFQDKASVVKYYNNTAIGTTPSARSEYQSYKYILK